MNNLDLRKLRQREHDIQWIEEQLANGMSKQRLAKQMGFSTSTLNKILKSKHRRQETEEQKPQLEAMAGLVNYLAGAGWDNLQLVRPYIDVVVYEKVRTQIKGK